MSEPTNFPLVWPENWPRAKFRETSRFKSPDLRKAIEKIEDEAERLGAKGLVISTNLKPTLGNRPDFVSKNGDVGAAVYFHFKNSPIALATDKWAKVADNLWAIACTIEHLRAQERWGVGNLEQAFSGYKALPEKAGGSLAWWQVFGYKAQADVKPHEVREKFKALANVLHPDKVGGDKDRMIELNLAYSEAAKFFKQHGIAST